jgi:hypothetical protein
LDALKRGYLDRKTRTGLTSAEADEAALAAGRRIREGDRSKQALENIVAWKNSDSRFWAKLKSIFQKNTDADISMALNTVVNASTATEALDALLKLHGIGVPTASAILAAIFPEKNTVIDQLALRALDVGNWETAFYALYNNYCLSLATRRNIGLRSLDQALWEWGKQHPPSKTTRRRENAGQCG